MCEISVSRALSTATSRTEPSLSRPHWRSAAVRCPAPAASGREPVVMEALPAIVPRPESNVEEHRLVVARQVDIETIHRAAVALAARRDQRGAAVGRHQRQYRI